MQAVSLDVKKLKEVFSYLKNIPLMPFQNVKPKLLIGSSHFDLIQHLRVVKGGPGEPIAVKSRLGWAVIMGEEEMRRSHSHSSYHLCSRERDENLHQMIKNSFSTEDFGVKIVGENLRSKEDVRALDIMEATTVKSEDGICFQTGLL